MLSTQALQCAHPIVQALDERTMIVTPIAGTILDQLCMATTAKEEAIRGNPGDWQIDNAWLTSITEQADPVTGYSEHTMALEEVAKKVSGAVINHLRHARTVVAPTVSEFVERILPGLEEATRNSMSSLEVVQQGLPALMYEPALFDSAKRAKDIPVTTFNLGMHLGQPDAASIVDYMLSGVASLDEAIAQFAGGLAEGELEGIWSDLFTAASTRPLDALSSFNASPNHAIVGFLVSRKIWDAPPEGTEMNLRTYEAEMVRIRDQSALHILRMIDREESDERAGVLIHSYTRTSVRVNTRVYKQYIASGGTNEVLFGNVLSSRPSVMLADVGERVEEFKLNWDRYCLMNRTTEANKRFELAKRCVRLEFDAFVRNASQDELPIQDREFVMQCFNEALNGTVEDDVLDPYKWILRLLCASVYRKTDALRILEGINRIKAASPDVDPREAAAVSACEYIAWWVAQQFKVEGGIPG